MLHQRTDLAMESHEIWQETAGKTTKLTGVAAREEQRGPFPISRVEVLDGAGARALGKPVGRYVTVDLRPLFADRTAHFAPAAEVLAAELAALLPEEGDVFVAGLGNAAMTPDALGPQTVGHLLITRHLREVLPDFRPVSAGAVGVLGTTGLETAEWVRGMAERAKPAAVIVVDALAARSTDRLCATVQISDTGIIPGSGVGNRRMALNRETLGVPVISVGVPTVVDALTLAADLLPEDGGAVPEELERRGRAFFVTPKDVDQQVGELSKLVGYGINMALHGLPLEDIAALLA